MSITIYNEPAAFSTAYRPTKFDVSSDLAGIVRMIADVYVDGTLETTIDRDPSVGETDQFEFEIGDVLQKYLTSEFDKVSSLPEAFDQTTSAKSYYVRFFEVEDNGTTLDTSWSEDGAGTNYEQSSTLDTLNAAFQHEQQPLNSNYILSSSSKNFATNRPQNTSISKNQYFYLGGAANPATTYYGQCIEYAGLNGTGSTVNSSNSGNVLPTNSKIVFGVDTSDLDSTTKSIGFKAFDSGNTQRSEEFIVNLKDACDEDVTLYWQNHYGIFDTYTFSGRYRQRTRTRTTTHEKRLDYTSTAQTSFDMETRGKEDIRKTNERTYEIYSTSEKPDTIKWLAEIGESVDVKIQKTINGTIYEIPINVKKVSTTIEDSERIIHQIKIEYTDANDLITLKGG